MFRACPATWKGQQFVVVRWAAAFAQHTVAVVFHAGLSELFKSIDADASGTITVEEMRKALMKWGHKINEV